MPTSSAGGEEAMQSCVVHTPTVDSVQTTRVMSPDLVAYLCTQFVTPTGGIHAQQADHTSGSQGCESTHLELWVSVQASYMADSVTHR